MSTDAMKVQAQIRRNAEEMQDYMRDMQRWEESMRAKAAKRGAKKAAPVRRVRTGGGVVPVRSAAPAPAPARAAAAHVYDRGYKKWDDFDVDAACRDVDQTPAADEEGGEEEEEEVTPATLAAPAAVRRATRQVPRPRAAPDLDRPRDVLEKEQGNAHFKAGEFEAAIKCYTRSLGINPRSAVVYSNRAMCYLKSKKYLQAQADCTLALRLDPEHAKSHFRRASARNGLGRHRAAFADLLAARELDAGNRQLRVELRKTKELIKSSIRKTPKTRVQVQVVTGGAPLAPLAPAPAVEPAVEPAVQPAVQPVASGAPTPVVTPATLTDAFPVQPAGAASPPRAQNTVRVRSSPTRAASTSKVRKRPKLPKSSFEMESTWRTLSAEERAAFLPRLKAKTMAKIFTQTVEPTLFTGMLDTVADAIAPADAAAARQVLEALATAPGLPTTMMFCRDHEREAIARALDAIGVPPGDALRESYSG